MNRLFYGDNLEVLRESVPDASVDLVYLDPPFNSNRNYNVIFGKRGESAGNAAQIQAFTDTWKWTPETEAQYLAAVGGGLPSRAADALTAFCTLLGENDALAYLVNMAPRLVELHRVLKPTGSLYLHCDPTMSHYLKILLDAIFGAERFANEIVWRRAAVKGNASTRFGRNHDVLLYYARGNASTFHRQSTEHSLDYAARFRFDDHDGRGPYRDGPLDSPGLSPNSMYEYKGYPSPRNGWRVSHQEMARLDSESRLIFPKISQGRIMRKLYLREREGIPVGDIWVDIAPINSQAAERLGYPTQKPVTLLERIISASTNEGDVVLDPFCGCGTTVDAAQRLGRRWIGIDVTYIAIDLIDKRMRDRFPGVEDTYEILGIPRDLGAARALFTRSPFDFERWAVAQVGAQPNEKQVGDKGSDGIARFMLDSKGAIGKLIVSVKGGKNVGPAAVRDLNGTVQAQKAQMGVLVVLEPPTRGMTDEANHDGTYMWPVNNRTYPRIQVVSVADLLAGKRPDTPPLNLPYIQASKAPRRDLQEMMAAS